MTTVLAPALRDAYDRIARLVIEHPDPSDYDAGWNNAVVAAMGAIEAVAKAHTEADAPSLHPRDRAVLDIIRRHQPVGMGKVSVILGSEAGGTIGRLLRKGLIRHPRGNVNLFELTA